MQSNTKALAELNKPARSFERPGLSADEVEEIREAFRLFDTDASGEAMGRHRGGTTNELTAPATRFTPRPTHAAPDAAHHAGTIDPKELKQAMQSLGLDAKSGVVYSMISAFDRDADKRIDFSEFLDLMTARMVRGRHFRGRMPSRPGAALGRAQGPWDGRACSHRVTSHPLFHHASCTPLAPTTAAIAVQTDRDSRADIDKVFRLFDVDGKGFITLRELARVSRELGEALTGELA